MWSSKVKIKMKKYKARNGASFSEKDAQAIGEELDNLKDAEGHITSKMILERAKVKKSILHRYFE